MHSHSMNNYGDGDKCLDWSIWKVASAGQTRHHSSKTPAAGQTSSEMRSGNVEDVTSGVNVMTSKDPLGSEDADLEWMRTKVAAAYQKKHELLKSSSVNSSNNKGHGAQ